METNDDFQFKPLSQGLGFHPRKKVPQSLRGLDFAEISQASSTEVLAPQPSAPPAREKKNSNPIYTIDEGLSLDEMPQYKVPLNQERPTTLNEARSQMELQTKSSQEKQVSKKNSGPSKGSAPSEKSSLNLRTPSAPTPSAQTAKQAVDDILKTLKDKKVSTQTLAMPAAISEKSAVVPATKPNVSGQDFSKVYQPTTMSWGAAFLDGLLVFATTLLCMIILLTVTKVDLLKTFSQSSNQEIYLALVGLLGFVNFIYMTAHRVILGQTPGEWAFDQRLGKTHEQLELNYVFKAASRTLILLATGVIILPLISKIIGRDLLSEATNLYLYEKKM